MNDVPSSHEPWDDVDALYRRASALDPSRPSASVDSAILAHAARVAAERDAAGAGAVQKRSRMRVQVWWRPAVFGTLAAAALAGLLVLPRALTPGGGSVTQERISESRLAAQRGEAMSSATSAKKMAPADAMSASGAMQTAPVAPAPAPVAKPRATEASSPDYESVAVTAQRRTQNDLVTAAPAATTAPEARDQSKAELAEVVSIGSRTRLFEAAKAGDLKKLEAVLAGQTAINSRDANGNTALLIATRNGQAQAVKMLLEHGADPNIAAEDGTTPLTAATAGGQPVIARALKRAGAH